MARIGKRKHEDQYGYCELLDNRCEFKAEFKNLNTTIKHNKECISNLESQLKDANNKIESTISRLINVKLLLMVCVICLIISLALLVLSLIL